MSAPRGSAGGGLRGSAGAEPPRVWYAAYGSNLSRARFECYISGGRPDGANREHPGCRDRSAPIDDRPWSAKGQLVFAKHSRNWGGGIAFLDVEADTTALLRLYLVTSGQFEDIHAQEGSETYPLLVRLGELDGHPVLTVTDRTEAYERPSPAYLGYVREGLEEAHGLGPDEVSDYLSKAPGFASELS